MRRGLNIEQSVLVLCKQPHTKTLTQSIPNTAESLMTYLYLRIVTPDASSWYRCSALLVIRSVLLVVLGVLLLLFLVQMTS